MLLDNFNRIVVQPLVARKNGSRHLAHLRDLERTQWHDPEVIRARQWTALKATLDHAYASVPYYRKAWQAAGIEPRDIRSWQDFARLPIVTKAAIREQESEFLSDRYDRATLIVKRTSGSTGVPLTIRIDEASKQLKYAATLRSDQWSGWRIGERVAKVWGNPEYRTHGLRGRLRNAIVERAVYLDTLNITHATFDQFIHQMRRRPPGLIFGHAHSLYLLAERLEAHGASDLRPHGMIATAMPLHRWQRVVIERVFGTRVTDRYGCEEVSLIASECEVHEGMHINADCVITEVEAGGRTGNLLITDLTNPAMPLIRYRNGDVVTLSDHRCSCGRGLPMMESIQGRDADYVITPTGAMISGISLTENFALKVNGTAQMQLVQERVDRLRIRIVPAREFGEASRRQIAGLVRETFGDGVAHEVELVERIPQEPSGKYRFCISHVPRAVAHV
jgi:phenylacetate-CoA ligase